MIKYPSFPHHLSDCCFFTAAFTLLYPSTSCIKTTILELSLWSKISKLEQNPTSEIFSKSSNRSLSSPVLRKASVCTLWLRGPMLSHRVGSLVPANPPSSQCLPAAVRLVGTGTAVSVAWNCSDLRVYTLPFTTRMCTFCEDRDFFLFKLVFQGLAQSLIKCQNNFIYEWIN